MTDKPEQEAPQFGPNRSKFRAVNTKNRKGRRRKDTRPPPTALEAQEIEEACGWLAQAWPVDARIVDGSVSATHTDDVGHVAVLAKTLGTRSPAFMNHALNSLKYTGAPRGKQNDPASKEDALNAGLALMSAVAPTNEIETALGLQMAGLHNLTAEMLGRARHADTLDQIKVLGGMAERLQKRFCESAETLAKLRTGGKQQVEVRYVYVDARNQQVVLPAGAGGGGAFAALDQPHAPDYLSGLAPPFGLPMRSADEKGDRVSVPGDPGEAEV